jgi:hypothetical protein
LGAARIVGVVGHVRHWDLDDPGTYNPRQIYIPAYQLPDAMVTDFFRTLKVIVRTTLPPADLVPAIRNVVYASSPDQPVYSVSTMDELMSESMASRNLPTLLLGTFAVLASLLSSVGIYGVVSFSVMRRTQEIGIRMAVGAERSAVFRMIVAEGIGMAGAGLGIGALAAIALVRLLPSFSHLLYGVGPKRSAYARLRLHSIAGRGCGCLLSSRAPSHAHRPYELTAVRITPWSRERSDVYRYRLAVGSVSYPVRVNPGCPRQISEH